MLKTFPLGGVHPPENKLSAGKSIETLKLPTQVSIPFGQHIGAPSTPVVTKGDKVKVGQLLAKPTGFVSTNIHSSVSGTVFKLDEIIDSSGYRKPVVIIKVEGDEWDESIDRSSNVISECKLSGVEITKKVMEAGIVGLGGATFPTHIKLTPPKGTKAEVLIINAVECEPYLTADHQLMMEKGEEIVVGIELLMKSLNVSRTIIGVENNKPDAIKHMKQLVSGKNGMEVCPLKVQYPQGGEKQLIKATINREVPSGKLPIEVGAVVQNVGTAFAVYEAVQKNKPLFERVVTVTGKSLSNPCNLMVRIGSPIEDLIKKAGGLPEDSAKIVGGGPMMGKALTGTAIPVTKGSSGVLIIRENEAKRGEMKDCIRCSKCISVCPMGLSPYLLMLLSEKEMHERAEDDAIMDCIECGSCSYTCPSNRPLLDYIRLEKGKVGGIIRNRKN